MFALAVVTALALVGPAAANPNKAPKSEARGGFQLSVHTHSNDDPDWSGLLFSTERLSYDFVEGETFAYSSRTCAGRAPFNDLGLDFRPDYPGVDDDDGTAAVRHHVQGTVTQVQGPRGDRGFIEGTITSVLCETVNGVQTETEHAIVTEFRARYRRISDNEVQLTGRFELSPTQSTGTFQDITGHGSFQGILVCLAHQRDATQPTCAERGHFTDFVGLRGDTTRPPGETQPGLVGTFRDPTVLTR
ncbi:MAG TPA: hypothetical protein VM324_05250 [Egibacteraceae bacterium]|nr:hypothetical protein [Egibacteraceae bacterium]